MPYRIKHVSVPIERPPDAVRAGFAAEMSGEDASRWPCFDEFRLRPG